MPALTPGVSTPGDASLVITASAATGGTAPVAALWQTSADGIAWGTATGTGITTLTATLTGLALDTTTFVRVRYTDSAVPAVVVYSAVAAVQSTDRRRGPLRWFPGLRH